MDFDYKNIKAILIADKVRDVKEIIKDLGVEK